MAISTTQSIWRSGGGDQTRQAYCGSGLMAATFWIPAAGSSANVQASSSNTATVILPAGAVITSVVVNDTASAGAIDLGYVVLSNSTAVTDGILNGLTATSIVTAVPGGTGAGTAMGTVMAASSNIRITSADGGSGSGNCGGVITYFVTDPLAGQQNV
jgi:hypothetical protein